MTESFQQWLRRSLERRELTQADLAKRVGTSTGTVSDWMNGHRLPNPESCDRLADALGADVDYVLTLAGHRPPNVTDDDPETAAVVATVRKIRWTAARSPIRTMLEEMAEYDRRTAAPK